MKFANGVDPYALGDLEYEEKNEAGGFQEWHFLSKEDAEAVYEAADASEKSFGNPRTPGGPYRVELGISQEQIDDANEFRRQRAERMVGRGIPPVSDYAHWNEDAEAVWYAENRYDMEHPEEVFDDIGW